MSIAHIIYASLAAIGTGALVLWVTRTLITIRRAEFDLRAKVAELASEVVNRRSIQDMLQRVLDTAPNGIMAFRAVRNAQGIIEDFAVLSANRQAMVLVGGDALVGRRLLKELPAHLVAGLFDHYVIVVRTGEPFRTEFQFKEQGMDRWFSNHAVKFEDGFMVTFSDITEQRRSQEINAESDRIALTEQITRTVAHEVRNPLTNIQLAMEQLHDEVEDREEVVKPFFEIIERNVKRIGGLITGMLASTQRRELDLVPCTLASIVESTLKNVGDRSDLKRMRVEVEVPADLPEVMADRECMDLAVTNIAINALEAMEEGSGVLRMTAYRVGDEVVLEVSDNGKGIPDKEQARLFVPFYSGRNGGLGLGLTTARSILHGHQVKLEVRSKVGVGTTFTLRFPSHVSLPGT